MRVRGSTYWDRSVKVVWEIGRESSWRGLLLLSVFFLFLLCCVCWIFSEFCIESSSQYVSLFVPFNQILTFWSWAVHLSWNVSGVFTPKWVPCDIIQNYTNSWILDQLLNHVGTLTFVFYTVFYIFYFLVASCELSVSCGLTFSFMCNLWTFFFFKTLLFFFDNKDYRLVWPKSYSSRTK